MQAKRILCMIVCILCCSSAGWGDGGQQTLVRITELESEDGARTELASLEKKPAGGLSEEDAHLLKLLRWRTGNAGPKDLKDLPGAVSSEDFPFGYAPAWRISFKGTGEVIKDIDRTGPDDFYLLWVGPEKRLGGDSRGYRRARVVSRLERRRTWGQIVSGAEPDDDRVRQYNGAECFCTDPLGRFFLGTYGWLFGFDGGGRFAIEVVTVHEDLSSHGNRDFSCGQANRFYITDGTGGVACFGTEGYASRRDGNMLGSHRFPTSRLPYRLSADSTNEVFLLNRSAPFVTAMDGDCMKPMFAFGTKAGSERLTRPTDIAANERLVAVAEARSNRILVFDRNGLLLLSMSHRSPLRIAISTDDTILAVDRSGATAYRRFYFPTGEHPEGEARGYLDALDLLEEGANDRAKAELAQLASASDSSLRTVAERLAGGGASLAWSSHFSAPAPPGLRAFKRILPNALKPIAVDVDPFDQGACWARLERGFVARADRFERVETFRAFVSLCPQARRTMKQLAFGKRHVFAVADNAVFYYDRRLRSWQVLPIEETKKGVAGAKAEGDALLIKLKDGSGRLVRMPKQRFALGRPR